MALGSFVQPLWAGNVTYVDTQVFKGNSMAMSRAYLSISSFVDLMAVTIATNSKFKCDPISAEDFSSGTSYS